jgi:hypothetical protein
MLAPVQERDPGFAGLLNGAGKSCDVCNKRLVRSRFLRSSSVETQRSLREFFFAGA